MSVQEGNNSLREKIITIKESAPVFTLVGSPILVVPFIAFVVFKDHPYWATGVGLLLGCGLAFVLGVALLAYHQIIVEEEKEKSKRQTRVQEAVRAGSAVEIAVVNMQKLDQYYALNRSQALWSFFASIGAVCLGFIAILVAARFATDAKQAIPGALAGVLLNFIGGAFFVMYNKSLQQLNRFYGKLIQLQDTMLAVQQCDRLPDPKAAEARENIILELIHRPVQPEAEMPRPEASKRRGRAGTKGARAPTAATEQTDTPRAA